jgi:hypothetical protein
MEEDVGFATFCRLLDPPSAPFTTCLTSFFPMMPYPQPKGLVAQTSPLEKTMGAAVANGVEEICFFGRGISQ